MRGLMQSLELWHLLPRHSFWKAFCEQYRKIDEVLITLWGVTLMGQSVWFISSSCSAIHRVEIFVSSYFFRNKNACGDTYSSGIEVWFVLMFYSCPQFKQPLLSPPPSFFGLRGSPSQPPTVVKSCKLYDN